MEKKEQEKLETKIRKRLNNRKELHVFLLHFKTNKKDVCFNCHKEKVNQECFKALTHLKYFKAKLGQNVLLTVTHFFQ
jgi:hypothetical protein